MVDPNTLRGRLTLAYASALVVALLAFAAVALAVIDRAQRTALDAQLSTTARALLAIVGESEGRVTIDDTDRAQFQAIVGTRSNGVVLQPDGDAAVSSSVDVPADVRRAAIDANGPALQTLQLGDERLRTFVAPVMRGSRRVGSIAVWRNAEFIGALDRSVAVAFALAIPILAILAMLFGAAITRRGLAPLERIATLASEIEGHDLSRRLALPLRNDELGRFAATFDRMLDRLQQAFGRERRFTSDASHELRAPLSVIRAEADLALRKERGPEEYRDALRVIAAEADALERLTRDLLAAARADSAVEERRGDVDLQAVAAAVAERLTALGAERGVRIGVVPASSVPALRADRDALERAVLTIAHNAIKYARALVELRVARTADAVELAVEDDGPGFSETALERAFERFWRDDDARHRDGTGLGLAIAKTTVERAGGSIAIANRPGGGGTVVLRFPV